MMASSGDTTEPGPAPATADGTDASRADVGATLGVVLGVLGATALSLGVVLYLLDPAVAPLAIANATAGFLGLAAYGVLNRRAVRRVVTARSFGLALLEAVIAGGALLLLIALNALAASSSLEWDLTKDRLYTLSEHSKKVALELSEPVRLFAFLQPGDPDREVLRGTVELYRQHTDQLKLELVNPDSASAELLQRFRMEGDGGRIVVDGPHRFTKLVLPGEEAITNALIKVTSPAPSKVYFLRGHGEPGIEDRSSPEGFGHAAGLLLERGYEVETTSLLERESLPSDAALVVIAGARAPFLGAEIDALREFLDRGGRALVLLEPGIDLGLAPLLRRHGARINDDLVMEPNPTVLSREFGPYAPIIRQFEDHPITQPLQNTAALFYRVRSVEPVRDLAGITATVLARTSPTSWGETSYQAKGDPLRDALDTPGPVPIALALSRRTAGHRRRMQEEARLVVVGDDHFISNRFSTLRGNVDFFLNATAWLAGDDQAIAIRPPRRRASRLPLTEFEGHVLMFVSVNLLPLLIIGLGFSAVAIRRGR